MVRMRDDLWRELEELHRLQAMQPSLDRAQEVRSMQGQLEAAEREWRRLRPSTSFDWASRWGLDRTGTRVH
jgi:hypothetical protein